jgi:homoserine trans-succinylase
MINRDKYKLSVNKHPEYKQTRLSKEYWPYRDSSKNSTTRDNNTRISVDKMKRDQDNK